MTDRICDQCREPDGISGSDGLCLCLSCRLWVQADDEDGIDVTREINTILQGIFQLERERMYWKTTAIVAVVFSLGLAFFAL